MTISFGLSDARHLGGTTDLLSAADSTAIGYQPEAISKKLLGPSCEPRARSAAWNWKLQSASAKLTAES
jgi:hypothetical protein